MTVWLTSSTGTKSRVQEVKVVAKPPIRIVYHHLDGFEKVYPNMKHWVFKVSVRDDMSYALDLSAAQYGGLRTVMPGVEYDANMVTKVCGTSECGSMMTECIRELMLRESDRQSFK